MQELRVIEVKGQRVLLTRQLAEAYGTERQIISNNYTRNKKRYIEGKHVILLEGEELRQFKASHQIDDNLKFAHILYLWTEKGALLHAKSLNTDKAWEVYDYLVDFYFRATCGSLRYRETEPPKQKESGREVVDVPENADMQKAILEVQKYLAAVDVAIESMNKYQCEGNYKHLKMCLDIFWLGLGRKLLDFMEIEPNLVTKEGY